MRFNIRNLLTLCGGFAVAGVLLTSKASWGEDKGIQIFPGEPVAKYKDEKLCFQTGELHKGFTQNFDGYQGAIFSAKLTKFSNMIPTIKKDKSKQVIGLGGYYEEQNLWVKSRDRATKMYKKFLLTDPNNSVVDTLLNMLHGKKKIWLHFAAYYAARVKLWQQTQNHQRRTSSSGSWSPYAPKFTRDTALNICADFIAEVTGGRYETRNQASFRTLSKCGYDTYDLNDTFKTENSPIDRESWPEHWRAPGSRSVGSLLPNGKSNFAFGKFSKRVIQRMPACAQWREEKQAREKVLQQCRDSMVICKLK